MIRATEPPVGENLAKLESRCKMFHVEQGGKLCKIPFKLEYAIGSLDCETFHVEHPSWCFSQFKSTQPPGKNRAANNRLFHVEHSEPHCSVSPYCSTWNNLPKVCRASV